MQAISKSFEGLWSLIQSMSLTERRLFIKKHTLTPTSIYLRLFKLMNTEELPSEAKVLNALKPQLTKKNLAHTKHYLQNKILDFLTNIESEIESYHLRLLQQIHLIKKLFLRNQTPLANNLLKHCYKEALKIENFTALGILEIEFAHLDFIHDVHKDFIASEKTSLDIDLYSNTIKLQRLYFQCITLFKKHQIYTDHIEYEEIQNYNANPLFTIVAKDSFIFEHYKTVAHSILIFLSGNPSEAVECIYKIVLAWQKQNELIVEYMEEYLQVLTIYAYIALQQKRYKEIKAVLQNKTNKKISASLNRYYFRIFKSIILMKMAEEEKDYPVLISYITKLKPYTNQPSNLGVSPVLRVPMFSVMAVCYFALGNTSEAESYCRQTLSFCSGTELTGHQRVMQLLLLVICYQKQNEFFFNSQYNICYQFLYRNKLLSDFEKLILQTLKKTFPFRKTPEKINTIQVAVQKINQYNCPGKKEILSFFHFGNWLQSMTEENKKR